MVASYFNCAEPGFGSSLDLTKIDENDDAITMTNDTGFYKNSDRSLSLNIRDNSGAGKTQSNGSASTTLNTTATTNTPVTNAHGLPSPDINAFGNFAFDSTELLNTPSNNFKFCNASFAQQQQQSQQPQQQRQDNYTTTVQSSSTARNPKSFNNKMKNRVSHTHTLSTPTAMNDFIAMLDAQSAIQEQFDNNSNTNSDQSSNDFILANRKERESSSPLQNTSSSSSQFIDPNLLKSNLFVDTFTQPNEDEFYDQSNFNSLLDEYVSTDMLANDNTSSNYNISEKMSHMHSSHCDNDRRHSDVVTNPVPEYSNNRNSISHSIDFWNLPDRRNTINGALVESEAAARSEKNPFNMDNELTQVLNDYNMNFTQASLRDSHISNPNTLNQRHGIKKQQRSSMSVLDGSLNNDLFSKLYKNGTQSSNLKVISWENPVLSDEEDEFGFKTFDPPMPSLKPITSPKSPKSISSNSKTKSKNQKFIIPSMMLSESASTAAKVATTGSEKIDSIQHVEKRKYDLSMNNPLKLSKSPPPHYHTIMPSPLISSANSSRRRRSTPNIMTIHSNSSTINPIPNSNSTNVCRGKSRSITPMSAAEDDAKPFKCKECPKAFRRSEHLKRHIRSVHSTERPFACIFCDKKFSRSDNLSQHLKTHKKHGDF